MKINEKDLDPTRKCDAVRKVSVLYDEFTPENATDFISYNGERMVYNKVNQINLKKVFYESEIEQLRLKNQEHMFYDLINFDNAPIDNFKSLPVLQKSRELFKAENDLFLTRKIGDSFYAMDVEGYIYEYDLKAEELIYSFNLIEEIRHNFAVSSIYIFDFLDIEKYGDGFLISLKNNGVFFVDVKNAEIELKFPELNIDFIKNLGRENVLLASKRINNNLMVYNFDTELKVETWNNLKKSGNQVVEDVFIDPDLILVLGKYQSIENAEKLLHAWEVDYEGLVLDNIDSHIFPGSKGFDYRILKVISDDDIIYLYGLKNNKLFVWKYNKENLNHKYEEYMFDDIKLDYLNNLVINDEKLFYIINNNLIISNFNKKILCNIKLENNILDIWNYNLDLIVQDRRTISMLQVPEYNNVTDINLKIKGNCNNIDVLIQGTNIKSVLFIDSESLSKITPEYMMAKDNEIITKLTNVRSKTILIQLQLYPDSVIDSIVVNHDNIYIK